MCSSGYNIRPLYRIWIFTAGNQTCKMRHIHHKQCAYFMSNSCHTFKVNDTGICAGSANNKLRPYFLSLFFQCIIINAFIFSAYTIRKNMEIVTRNVYQAAMRKMPAIIQIHTKNRISRFQHCIINTEVCLGAGMWLYIDMISAKQFLCPVNGQLFNLIDELTTTIIPLARISFCVFIGQYTALRFHNRIAGKIF